MKLVFIYGPTASGKTDLAIRLAEAFGGEIINCDSVSVYKHVQIGAAKPDATELARIPHHLVSHIDFPNEYNAADFSADARAIIKSLKNRGEKICFVVGGTGFYFRALEYGMPAELKIEESVKTKIIEDEKLLGIKALFTEIQNKDLAYADQIHKNDKYRILRALELIRSGFKPSEQFKKRGRELREPTLKVYLKPSREHLEARIEKRCARMLEQGLIEEVKKLLSEGMGSWPPMNSVGYKETADYVQAKQESKEELQKLIQTHSLQLAKRQKTWFNKEEGEVITLESPDFSYEKLCASVQAFLHS